MITERAELELDASWAETGDRYLLKLFRDWVFHRHTDTGAPSVDWGFVVEALNKLDAGVPEKILLMSRDEMSMLVVSYREIKVLASCCLSLAPIGLRTALLYLTMVDLGSTRAIPVGVCVESLLCVQIPY